MSEAGLSDSESVTSSVASEISRDDRLTDLKSGVKVKFTLSTDGVFRVCTPLSS
jgi:hypothetical protein